MCENNRHERCSCNRDARLRSQCCSFSLGLVAWRATREPQINEHSHFMLATRYFCQKDWQQTSEQGHSRCQECVKVRTDVALCSPRRVTRASDRARAVFKTCTRCNAQDLTESVIANVLVSDQAVPTNVVPTVSSNHSSRYLWIQLMIPLPTTCFPDIGLAYLSHAWLFFETQT